MRVSENWDRPCGPASSYYPPLRFTDLIESEAELCVKHRYEALPCSNTTYPEKPTNGGLGSHVPGAALPVLAETSVAACGGSSRSTAFGTSAFGSSTFGTNAFGTSAFGTGGFWNTSAAADGCTHSRVPVASDAACTGLSEQMPAKNSRWESTAFGAQQSESKNGLQSRSDDGAIDANRPAMTQSTEKPTNDGWSNHEPGSSLPVVAEVSVGACGGSSRSSAFGTSAFGTSAFGTSAFGTSAFGTGGRHAASVENDEVNTTGMYQVQESYGGCNSATHGCHPNKYLGARDDGQLLGHKDAGKAIDHRDDSTVCNSDASTRASIRQDWPMVEDSCADTISPMTAGAPMPVQACEPAEVDVRGSGVLPQPWHTWDQVAFPTRVRSPLISAGFPAPTLIQQYGWPILKTGRDVVGVAKTGSGKTLAFLLPAFAMLIESNADTRGPPAILVLAPTRELACQIEQEAKQFGAIAGMRATCLYGGAPKGPQLAELRQRPQVLVATPGRLNDLLDPPPGLTVAVDVKAVRYLVLDEADRMLDMGFEPQIRKVINTLPQERQTVMFTATWPNSVRRLASDFLRDFVEVRIGEADNLMVNADIEQRIVLCDDMFGKEQRLVALLQDNANDQTIIFVNTKRECETVALRVDNSVVIHGDKDQQERDMALNLFKSGSRRVLVATDVAARGLDVKDVRLVINFDPPNREEDYVHRVGRTGRAGNKGTAVTFLTNNDGSAAQNIVDIFRRMNLTVPAELERRLASGEMRSGGRGGGRDGPRRFNNNRRGLNSMDGFGDLDMDVSSRFSNGLGHAHKSGGFDFGNSCFTDCPT